MLSNYKGKKNARLNKWSNNQIKGLGRNSEVQQKIQISRRDETRKKGNT